MTFKTSCIAGFILILGAAVFPFLCSGTEPLRSQPVQQAFPSLMESIQFKTNIQYCNVNIPLEHQDIKERLEKEMLLAVWDRPQVILWMKRAGKYFPHVEDILHHHGLPLDLKYVPLIESALRPHAGSAKGAVGYWQFLKSTGKRHGLRIDSQVDERRNIFKSTHAACDYIKALKTQFGSYLLALSAYNMGEYGLKGEIELQKSNDFFSLYLPLETQRYIFKLICAKLILENPASYGFFLEKSDLYPVFAFDRVTFTSGAELPISFIAQVAGLPFKTIKDYNPELRGYYLGKGKRHILVPKGTAKGFNDRFSAYYKHWKKTANTKFHTVKRGENLTGIAKAYQISLFSLLKSNNLSVNGKIYPGDRLLIE
ncbi:lytic transglycosylase domain-containing protein [Desulfobacula sp.]|uniref:lytic transglycosylase domain-containing protein n=1 Tax=Desulfobacula sp. TaxID=2593537 RepID=UPI00261F73EA|nr:lytic transglycosylase domain-containing protein [Desulfobacula sp.]